MLPDGPPTTREAPSPTGSGLSRPLGWALAAAVVGLANLAVALDAVAPVQTKDEIGYLAAARWLATGQGDGLLTPDYAGGYAVGWGFLSAPVWWLTGHPPTVYAVSVGIGVALSVLVLLPAAALARALGARPGQALLLASVLCLGAGRLGYTGYALPEGLLTLQLTTLAWLLVRLAGVRGVGGAGRSDVPWGTLGALALLLAWLPTTHARFLPAAALGVGVLAGWAWAARPGARAASVAGAVAAAAAVAGAGAGWWLNGHVEAQLYGEVSRTAVAADQVVSLRLLDVVALAVGHAWYAVVAWLGLTVLGWLALLRPARDELAARRPGVAAWLVTCVVAQLVVGAAYLSTRLDQGARVDQLVYGRYGDPLWFVLALVGGAALLARPAPARLLGAASAATVLLSAATFLMLRTVGDRAAGFVQLNVPGLEAWAWRSGGTFVVPWPPATALAVVVLGLLVHLARRSRAAGPSRVGAIALVGVVLASTAAVAEQRNIQPRDAWIRQMFTARDLVDGFPEAPVLLVEDRPLLLTGTAMQWWLADRDPALLPAGRPLPPSTPDGALVLGPVAAPPPAYGALRLVGVEPSGRYAVWRLDR